MPHHYCRAASLQSRPVNETAIPATVAAEYDLPDPPDSSEGTASTVARRTGRAPGDVAYPKAIKSFVRRAGRTTTGQAKALAELGPRVLLPYQPTALDFEGRPSNCLLRRFQTTMTHLGSAGRQLSLRLGPRR